jgi:rubrerythrin
MAVQDDARQASLAHLRALIQLDVDASYAYAQAIAKIDILEIAERLEQFRQDHERHIEALSSVLREFGVEPPDGSPDLKGQLIQGYTALRAAMGLAGALRAMKSNELLTNSRYEAAVAQSFPAKVKRLLERHREDERGHLAYIEAVLKDRTWELDAAPAGHGRFTADLGQLALMGVGACLIGNAAFRPGKLSAGGAAIGVALMLLALQSGIDPGGMVEELSRPRRRSRRTAPGTRARAARQARSAPPAKAAADAG